MKRILLASHLSFAQGILDTLQFIIGEQENIEAVCVYTEADPDPAAAAESYMQKSAKEDEIIVVTDIYGGSVNNSFMKYMERPGFYLIAGMNLPLLIELVNCMEMDTEEQVRYAVENCGTAIDCRAAYEELPRDMTGDAAEEGI